MKKTKVSSSSKNGKLDEYLYLTTRGRRTGMPREIEIWFTKRAGRFYVIAESPTSHWVKNIRADPKVEVKVAHSNFQALARLLSFEADAELSSEIRELSRRKYGWGEGLVVEIVPSGSGAEARQSRT